MTTKAANTRKVVVQIQSTNFTYGNDGIGNLETVAVGYMAKEISNPNNYMSGSLSLTSEEVGDFSIRDLHEAVYQKLKSLFIEDTNSN